MYIVFLLLWILLNGQFNMEILLFGLVIAGVMYAFFCKFLEYSPAKDILLLWKLPYILMYVLILIWEIIKANIHAIRLALSYRSEIDPVIVKFQTDLKSRAARVALANSITLTPGTITVALEEDELIVHALDVDLVRGIDDSVFVHMLRKMEAIDAKIMKRTEETS
ncbi:MAG: Na+/H+ antiporter subunit E [Lachnospiraceae bacterium]|nr:Na+/H+ antiporter subunit E [Lachnospiraceae bacterium]